MFCGKCGTENISDAVFCKGCGAALKTESPGSRDFEATPAPKKKFPVVPIAIAAVVLLIVIIVVAGNDNSNSTSQNNNRSNSASQYNNRSDSMSNSGNSSSNEDTTDPEKQDTVSAPKELTPAEKQEWVMENVPEIKNDFRVFYAYEDMMGMPLADLKNAVTCDERYVEETSLYTEFSEISKWDFSGSFSYRFSDREFNDVLGHDYTSFADGLLTEFANGFVNATEASGAEAQYYFVVTDNTSNRCVSEMVIVCTNFGASYSDVKSAFDNLYGEGKILDNGAAYYEGLVSEPDYEAIYDYYNSLTSNYPDCMGSLSLFDNKGDEYGDSFMAYIIKY